MIIFVDIKTTNKINISMKNGFCIWVIIAISLSSCKTTLQEENTSIRINQIGFHPSQEKIAVWDNESSSKYIILDEMKNVIDEGETQKVTISPFSQKQRYTIDLNSITQAGNYTLLIDSEDVDIDVKNDILTPLSKAAIRSFYYQRSGVPLQEQHAGKWNRPAAHLDTLVYIHPNAADDMHEANSTISSPYGWYDAGDYNKYIVNSAYSIGLILTGYQLIPHYYENLSLNIPESNNSTPDILDEMYFNLNWMLTMQDSCDGGVYHKLTTPNFEGFIAPSKCKQKRYVVAKSTAATLDFAAVMAQASRIYQNKTDYPEFSIQAINAAKQAYQWAKQNPNIFYDQKKLNSQFKPEITTGEYGDRSVEDEFYWAACELYVTTLDPQYLKDIKMYMPKEFANHGWGKVDVLGIFSLLINKSHLYSNEQTHDIIELLQKQLLDYAKLEMKRIEGSSFNSMFGNKASDFGWGCLAENCVNPAISVLIAGRLCDNQSFEKYLQSAFHNMDYILGRNATGFCYVTGLGSKSPMNIHHRLSAADNIDKPLPGFLVGGPNPNQEDKNSGATYRSTYVDESYSDTLPSYASNEIAINWSASLVVLAGLLDAWGND